MEFEEKPLTEVEEMKEKILRDKSIRENNTAFQEEGIEFARNNNNESTPPPKDCK